SSRRLSTGRFPTLAFPRHDRSCLTVCSSVCPPLLSMRPDGTDRIKAAERCCLRRLERGRYLITAICDHPDHAFTAAIAAAPTTTLPAETNGLPKRPEDLRRSEERREGKEWG